MNAVIRELDCNIFGDFKVGDNAKFNADLLCHLVEANERGRFNKLIVIQVASLLEAAFSQIFYRAKRFNREGVPNISEIDRQAIADKQIDKLAVIIDNLNKYEMLDDYSDDIYDNLHDLRKYRNKIHIQHTLGIPERSPDEAAIFNRQLVRWALNMNWQLYNYLQEHYQRPEHIQGYVQPLRLPVCEE